MSRRPPNGLLIAVAIASLGLLWVVWSVDYFPSHDGPHHLFHGFVENHYADAGARYAEFLTPGTPISGVGFYYLFAAFESLMPWRPAYASALSLMVILWGLSSIALCRAIDPQRGWMGLIGMSCALSWSLYMGFFAYVLGMAMAMATIALAIRLSPWTWRRAALLTLAMAVCAVVHIFGALVVALVIGCLTLRKLALNKSAVQQLLMAALICAPALLIAYLLTDGPPSNQGAAVAPALSERIEMLGALSIGGPWWRSWPVIVLALGGVAFSLRDKDKTRSALAIAAALFWACALIAPLHVSWWRFLSPRFLPPAIMLSLALLPIERFRFRAACAVIAFSSIAWAGAYTQSIRQHIDVALSGFDDTAQRNGPRMTAVLDPYAGLAGGWSDEAAAWRGVAMPFYAPLFNLGPLYAVHQGGVPSHIFSHNPLIQLFVKAQESGFPATFMRASLRDRGVLEEPSKRAELVTWLAMLGRPYEDVLLYGEPRDVQLFVARGYAPSHRRGGLVLARFVGCRARALISWRGELDRAIVIERGWGGSASKPMRIDASKLSGNELAIDLRHTLCGAGWVRVSSGSRRCARHAVITAEGATLRCDL